MNTPSDRGPGELLPCPFCGKAPRIVPPSCKQSDPYRPGDHAFPLVRCCHVDMHGDDWDESCATAAANWNRRPALGEWLPIENRPKSGTYLVTDGTMVAPWINGVIHNNTGTPWDWNYGEVITHWQPLPAPPRPTQERSDEQG